MLKQIAIDYGRRKNLHMGPSLQKLLEIGGAPFVPRDADSTVETFDRLGEVGASMSDVLRQ